MGFFKKRKARKLAEQQAKAALEQKKAEELLVKQQSQTVKEEPVKLEVKATPKVEQKTVAVKQEPIVEKKVEAPIKKAPVVEKKVEAPAQDETKKEPKPAKYHVSQNKDPKSDNHRNWRVRKEGSEKTIKFFSTQKEAIEYAESLAVTAGSSVVIHKLDGSIRKQSYTKKE
ncbi:MAG: DUF2188 domain-containing protein [Acholeplasmataceae bacterium]|nr:DUF2188 domain-containing protein [Acholeplasmataceae bacterium]